MRRLILSRLARWALVLGVVAPGVSLVAGEPTARTTLSIKGMTCGGCVAAVKLQLKRTEGVTAYEVSLEKAEARVTYDPGKTTPQAIAASVSKTGFEASVKKSGEDASASAREPLPRAGAAGASS